MKIEMKSSFAKAMKKITQPKMANEVACIIDEIQAAKNLSEVRNIKKTERCKKCLSY